MDSFKDLKERLMQKFHFTSTKQVYEPRGAHCRTSKALTPRDIPEFVIPGSDNSSKRTNYFSVDDDSFNISEWHSLGRISHNSSPAVTPTDSPTQTKKFMHRRGDMTGSSSPVTPQKKWDCIISSTDDCDNQNEFTNDDPLSTVAMSLEHLRTKTSYGFTTLSESPKTLRKESLFHSCKDSLQKDFEKLTKQDSSSKSKDKVGGQSFPFQLDQVDSRVIPKSSNPCVIATTKESLVFAKDSKSRSTTVSNELLVSTKKSHPFKRHRVYNRQRSSLADQVYGADSEVEHFSEEISSLTRSSIAASKDYQWQRTGEFHAIPGQGQTYSSQAVPNVSASVLNPNPLKNQEKILSSSHITMGITPQVDNLYAPHGELKFTFQYLAASRQFKVCLIRAENLGRENKTDIIMNSFATLYLMPAKLQKQSGIVVKRTKNPNFNQVFYFHQLTLDQLHNMALRIKLFNKRHNLKLAEFIGDVIIPLESYDLLQESRMWKDLEKREDREVSCQFDFIIYIFGGRRKDSGFLELALQFRPREGLLKVTIHQAKSLPYHHLTGAPNPYIKVELSQPNRSVSTKRTKTKKNTCFPVFAESFSFTVSPKMDDLCYTTLTISVFDYKRLFRDDIIGQIIVGSTSTEESLLVYWDDVITNPEKTVTKWHCLTEVKQTA
ncbi:hypothetical protein CHS0354_003500 [Potamilus streckersoni]|uniref:C2 domain-containing protein n=1 Tax=Potamilus streckersoni TaxID=2493646 RepID=A0AAE0SZQ1_9BIVA|nr:hypothetical protein CHS0354_003500 [Potamilus streckersoni]